MGPNGTHISQGYDLAFNYYLAKPSKFLFGVNSLLGQARNHGLGGT